MEMPKIYPVRRAGRTSSRRSVVENEPLVFTDAYTKAWEPSQKPFMTVILTFDDEGGGKTRYTARVRHWTVADREAHEKMGFHGGLGPVHRPARRAGRQALRRARHATPISGSRSTCARETTILERRVTESWQRIYQ
jgi:hypothetical protein